MRPTVDEQLAGATRLLRLAESDPGTTGGAAELVRNARRLVERIAGSWSVAQSFLEADSGRTAALLGRDPPEPAGDLHDAAERNEALRADLTRLIHTLPAGPERTAIGVHLRARVDLDPT